MKAPRRVIWSEGLLMTPQHMQQLDSFHEGLLHARFDAVDGDSWGVLSCELDSQALDSGMVAVRNFEGVMPDGTPLSFDSAAHETPGARPVEGHFEAHQNVLEVYLGVARLHEARNNVAGNKGDTARYYASSDTLHDRHGEAQPQDVDIARLNVRILFGDEARQDFSAIKVAEITRSGAGNLVAVDGYIPPCLRTSAAPALGTSLSKLLTAMNARRTAVISTVRQRDDSTVEYGAPDVTRYLLLDAINAYIPLLKHFVEAGDVSPKGAYLLLAQLAGQLSTFSTAFDPNDVPRFVFTDLRATFDGLIGAINQLLGATLEERYVGVTLKSRGDGLHVGEITDDRFEKCTQFIVGITTTVAEEEATVSVPRLARLASSNDINSLLAAATAGVELNATMKPPPQIPTKAGMTYFVVRTQSSYWRNILLERKFAMYLPNPFSPTETEVQVFGVLD